MRVNVAPSHIPLTRAHSQLHARDVHDEPLCGGWRFVSAVWKDDGPVFDGRKRHRNIPCSFFYHTSTNWAHLAVDLFYWLEAHKQVT